MLMPVSLFLFFCEASSRHTSQASHVDSQLGGHFSLGNTTYRNAVTRAQLASVQLPSLHADCGGIDLFLGGFNYINEQQFIHLLKNIMSSARGYAFMLAMESVSPMIASVMKKIQEVAQRINQMSLSSCEASAALIGAVVPRHSKAAQHTCTLMASQSGQLTDYVSAMKGCGEQTEQRQRTQNTMDTSHKDVLHERFNVAWKVLSKHSDWPQTTKEMVMTMTGTIITAENGQYQVYSPRALDDGFFDAYIKGGTTEVYRCGGDAARCLIINRQNHQISPHDNHVAKIKETLKSIETKIYNDEPISDTEKYVLEGCQIPIVKIINIMTAYLRGECPLDIMTYAELIAEDVLNKHIRELVEVTRDLANGLKGAQMNIEPLNNYIKQLDVVEKKLRARDIEIKQRVNQIFNIIKQTLILERALIANKKRGLVKE